MVPLGRTNKATGGVRLSPATVRDWQVCCGCFCVLLNTQWLFLRQHRWFNPPSASHLPPPPPHPPPARPPPIELIHDISGAQKKVCKNPAVLAS